MRGPKAASRYSAALAELAPERQQQVLILHEGFAGWQGKFRVSFLMSALRVCAAWGGAGCGRRRAGVGWGAAYAGREGCLLPPSLHPGRPTGRVGSVRTGGGSFVKCRRMNGASKCECESAVIAVRRRRFEDSDDGSTRSLDLAFCRPASNQLLATLLPLPLRSAPSFQLTDDRVNQGRQELTPFAFLPVLVLFRWSSSDLDFPDPTSIFRPSTYSFSAPQNETEGPDAR